jgi:hypothetical protein
MQGRVIRSRWPVTDVSSGSRKVSQAAPDTFPGDIVHAR